MQVTILGGLGYIGSHLLKMVAARGYTVKTLDCEMFGKDHVEDVLSLPNVTHIKGNVCNTLDLIEAIKGSDCVINLAGLVGDPACALDEEQTWLYNIEANHSISDVCNYCGVQKLIFASSCSVYGAAPSDVFLNEGSYRNPVSLYAKTKIDSEKVFFTEFDGITSVIRLATVFGYSRRMRFDLVANLFTIKALTEHKIEVFGGTQYRPFVHCVDAARAFLHVLEYKEEEKIDKEIFNVSSCNLSIRELGEVVCEVVRGTDIKIVDKKEDNRNYKVDSSKIDWLLGFTPSLGIYDGLQDMVDRIKMSNVEDWQEDKYHNHKICGIKL